jgi:virulence factor Mce-like protein
MTRARTALSAALVILLLTGCAVLLRANVFRPTTITAQFTAATGVYPGDDVRVAGVKVGTITAIRPDGAHVTVTLQVAHGIPVPAEARAVIVAPNLVAARYVQLAPA